MNKKGNIISLEDKRFILLLHINILVHAIRQQGDGLLHFNIW